jgi:hypothetical protein
MADTTFSPGTTIASAWLNDVNKNIYDTQTAPPGTLKASLFDGTNVLKGPALIPFSRSLFYATGSVGGKLREFKTFKDFGAVGDGVADDTAAVAAALASNATVMDDMNGSTFRITSQIAIPTSCFTKFVGVGNVPVPKSKFFVDFDGAAFKGAVGTTSFPCFENFYCYSLPAYLNAQFMDHDGDLVHAQLERLVFFNFRKIAVDLNSAFRCHFDFLGQYCWDYMLKIMSGSASQVKFTADHSYAGGIYLGVNTGGFVVEPYTEMICSDNDPLGANASWPEMYLSGSNHQVIGGVLSLHPANNKIPIELNVARAISFDCVSGFSLGAAAYWINLNATDSSVTLKNSPLLTVGGAGAARRVEIDPGYSATQADIRIAGTSLRSTTSRAWVVFDGAGGVGPASIRQANGITTVTKTATGAYTIAIPAGTFANASYSVNISLSCATAVAAARYIFGTKSATSIQITVNNTASTATVDADEVAIEFTGP